MIKKRNLKLSKLVSKILVLSGIFQMAVLQMHIDVINNLFSSIIGFYMFGFMLFTIINILNGANFTAKKSVVSIGAIYLITGIQIAFGSLFIGVILNEVKNIAEVVMDKDIIITISFFGVSMVASILACIFAVLFYFRKSELDIYFG